MPQDRIQELRATVRAFASELEPVGANLTVELPDGSLEPIGPTPERARVNIRSLSLTVPLRRRNHLALAEAYLRGAVDLDGDLQEVVKVAAVAIPRASLAERVGLGLKGWLRDRRSHQRESISFHYDRPAEFFLPWFERWRSYSHGLYETPEDRPEEAQARKLRRACEALALKPGMRVLDVGCGWGSFLEYAGRQGVRVHGITISAAQQAFVGELIEREGLPCEVELVDFLDLRPDAAYDGAVFMGSLEHLRDYRRAADSLARWLNPEARIWADFCTTRHDHQVGSFLGRHIWPGTASYVNVPKLVSALVRAGFNILELRDDTRSYALTCRDWADALEAVQPEMEARWGRAAVRAFVLYLRGSEFFFATNRNQAAHLVAGGEPAPLERW